jgi:hypothetical protein
MANKHSRQGLALGVSLAMGSTLISGLPAAADYQNLMIQIANETTNGVLATTMGSGDFELETEWDPAVDGSDLAFLRYELTWTSSDGSTVDSEGDIQSVSWDVAEDDVDVNYPERWDNATIASGSSELFWAPAYVLADDERVDYTYNIVHVESGLICETGTLEAVDSNEPPQDYSYRYTDTGASTAITMTRQAVAGTQVLNNSAECGPDNTTVDNDFSGDGETHNFNVTFSAGTGYAGDVDAPAPMDFESLILIEDADSSADWVDVKVFAWLDKDLDGDVDPTESYSAPVTVRFWNPLALTATMTIDETWLCYAADALVGNCTENAYDEYFEQNFTVTLDQHLNNAYADADDFDWMFAVSNFVDNEAGLPVPPVLNNNVAYLGGTNSMDDAEDVVWDYYTWDDGTTNWENAFDYDYENLDEDFSATAEDMTFSASTYIDAVRNLEADSDDNHFVLVHEFDVDQVATRVSLYDALEDGFDFEFGPLDVGPIGHLVWLNIMDSVDEYSFQDVTASMATGAVVAETLVKAEGNDALVRIDDETVNYVISVVGGKAGDVVEVDGFASQDILIDGEEVAAGNFTLDGILDAEGTITFAIVNEDATEGDIVSFDTVYDVTQDQFFNDADGQYDASGTGLDFVIEWDASDWTLAGDRGFADSATVQVGSTFSMEYTVSDQWNQVPGNGLAVVEFDALGLAGDADRDYGGFSPDFNVVNGSFTVTLPDTNPEAGEGLGVFFLTLYTRPDLVSGFEEYIVGQGDTWKTVEILYLNDVVVDEISIDLSDTSSDVAYGGIPENSAGFSGYVENSAGVELTGHLVTVSGSGVSFDGPAGLSGNGSLTFYTDENGRFSFEAAHTRVGTHAVLISVGGKSTTVSFTVDPASVRAQNIVLSSFDAKAGTVSEISASLTDMFGNVFVSGTEVTFRRTFGSGYFVPIDGEYAYPVMVTTSSNANGVATAQLIVLPGEVGFSSTVIASITHQNGGQVVSAQRNAGDTLVGSIQPHAWTKLQSDGTVKMYAKNIVGIGKVQFFHNGGEIAWVRAADALNPKLREANGAYYLVRTRDLLEGKNVFEIYIDGERVRRTAYSK